MTGQPDLDTSKTAKTPHQSRACCGWCGKPITGPLWRRWCSDACKMRAYRARKARKTSDTQQTQAAVNV